jgi:hypothetical protein
MVTLSSKSGTLPARKIGVECFHGFGDGLFNAPFLEVVSRYHGSPVGVAVKPQCADAYANLPWVDEIVPIGEMGSGERVLKGLGYQYTHQITPNVWFPKIKERHPNHSLIDTPSVVAQELGYPAFDPRPVFRPTGTEAASVKLLPPAPLIAIESVYNSQHSWAKQEDFLAIVSHYRHSHRIIWLSHQDQPNDPSIYPLPQLRRRDLIMCLQRVETFFCVGSGFFCGTLALPKGLQPRKTVCLWVDETYRYKERLAQLKWNENICWVDDRQQLHREHL